MRVSVVVCTRNGAAFLEEQLSSILRQTPPPSEIIISDDGSSDLSPAIIRAFQDVAVKSGIDCHVISNEPPLGVTGNFEAACMRSTGDVIFLADQDDVWHADKMTRSLAVLGDEQVVLVSSNAEIIDASGMMQNETLFSRLRVPANELALLAAGELADLILYRTAFTGATLAFKRRVLEQALPFSRALVHDEWLVHVAWLTGEVRTLIEPIMAYRVHASNTIGLDPPPIAASDASRGGLLRLHLERIISKLTPLIEHFSTKPDGQYLVERLTLRKRQLALASTRRRYPSNMLRRAGSIMRAWSSGLYRVDASPAKTACLDLFRSAKKGRTA